MRALYIRYIERKLIWEYTQRWAAPPLCNIKVGAPGENQRWVAGRWTGVKRET